MIIVRRPGLLATIQDLGRPGYGSWGIVPGGAADRSSLTLANRLVGNPESSAGLEITTGRFRAVFVDAATIALTGADVPVVVGDRAAATNQPIRVPRGSEVVLGSPRHGLRTYLAVRGGLDTPRVLGSRATDLVAGIGRPLAAGDELPVGAEADSDMPVDLAPTPGWSDTTVIAAVVGPRHDLFTPDAMRTLATDRYTVSPLSNRIGIRLIGRPLRRRDDRDQPSEPTIRGAVEVPPDGQPILFLADHPTTCGYPVICVAELEGVDRAAQLRPGDRLSFRLSAPDPL